MLLFKPSTKYKFLVTFCWFINNYSIFDHFTNYTLMSRDTYSTFSSLRLTFITRFTFSNLQSISYSKQSHCFHIYINSISVTHNIQPTFRSSLCVFHFMAIVLSVHDTAWAPSPRLHQQIVGSLTPPTPTSIVVFIDWTVNRTVLSERTL